MNVILLVVVIVIIFFIIQKNTKFAKNNYPINSSPRGENGKIVSGFRNILDLDTKEDKRRKLVNVLHNISESDKVVLTDVSEKWSMNKNVIDFDTNKRSVEILKQVMNSLEFFSTDKFYVKNVENVYVMKDEKGNYRTVISAFIYDIKNYHTVKIIIDAVFFENILYINHIDIDESGIKNVLQHYDIKFKSSGILTNHNNFDTNVEALLDNYYKEKYKVIKLKHNAMVDLSNTFSFNAFKEKVMPRDSPHKSNIFCNKESTIWNSLGISLDGNENCLFNNPTANKYPPEPLYLPNGIVNNVDLNQHAWMWNPDRGDSV